MSEEIVQLIKDWKEEISKNIHLDKIYLFGSSIYNEGRMFKSGKSDLDLIVRVPDSVKNAIERKEWIENLKNYKQELEKRALFLLKNEKANLQIVSVVPITDIELLHNIHKGETRNFFEVNEFLNIDNGIIQKVANFLNLRSLDNELAIQVLKRVQKARNEFLKNSALGDSNALEWEGDDLVPKALAREAAKIVSLVEGSVTAGDEFNPSYGCDFIKQSLKSRRETPDYLDLYTWLDDRSGGRSSSSERNILSSEKHLLLYELLYDLVVPIMKQVVKKAKMEKPNLTQDFNLFLEDTEMLSKAHSKEASVALSDIFVGTILKQFDESKDELEDISFDELVELFNEEKKILIAGEGQSGKTALCKQMFIELHKKGLLPVFLDDRRNRYLGSLVSKLEKSVKSQYGDQFNWSDLDKDRVVLILDNFHYAKHKEKIITNMKDVKRQILIVDDIFGFDLKNETHIESHQRYRINEFSPSQRYELIKNWVLLSDNTWTTDNEIYKEIDSKMELVDAALGKIISKGIMPSFPFFILSFISNYDTVNKPLDQNITSQGYFYQSLIYIYLRKEGVKNDDFDTYFNFLTELAFFFF